MWGGACRKRQEFEWLHGDACRMEACNQWDQDSFAKCMGEPMYNMVNPCTKTGPHRIFAAPTTSLLNFARASSSTPPLSLRSTITTCSTSSIGVESRLQFVHLAPLHEQCYTIHHHHLQHSRGTLLCT